MPGASALARLAHASKATRPHSNRRRSTRPAPMTTSGAHTAATMAGTDSIKPPMPADISRLSTIGSNRPTGSISVVTTLKVARPAAATPGQPRRLSDPGRTCAAGSGEMEARFGSASRVMNFLVSRWPDAGPTLKQSTDSNSLIKWQVAETEGTIRGQSQRPALGQPRRHRPHRRCPRVRARGRRAKLHRCRRTTGPVALGGRQVHRAA
ncbi:hypothetical protein D3C87_1585250 [compost metagenome]